MTSPGGGPGKSVYQQVRCLPRNLGLRAGDALTRAIGNKVLIVPGIAQASSGRVPGYEGMFEMLKGEG